MRHTRAFTLIELITIVSIFGTLAMLSLPSYHLLVTRAHVADVIAQLEKLRSAEADFYIHTGKLPSSLDQIHPGSAQSVSPYVSGIRLDDGGKLVAILNTTHMALVSASSNEIAFVPKPAKTAVSWTCGPNTAKPVSAILLPSSCLDAISEAP